MLSDPTHGLFHLPSKEERRIARNGAPLNPIKLAMMLTPLQGAMFFSGWLAWTVDAWDFFAVSLSVSALVTQFGKSTHDITTAITLTLLFRSVGAAIFGYVFLPPPSSPPIILSFQLVLLLTCHLRPCSATPCTFYLHIAVSSRTDTDASTPL